MLDSDLKRLRQLYAGLMEETKGRLVVIGHIKNGKYQLPPVVAFELAYLQLRLICETIGLCCLAAHGDIDGTKTSRLQSAYQADMILKALEKLHPRFFPEPVTVTHDENGMVDLVGPSDPPAITKIDLIRLYYEAGEILHRGAIKEISRRTVTDDDWSKIYRWTALILALVREHTVELFEPGKRLWIVLEHPEDGRSHVFDLWKVGESSPPDNGKTPPENE